MWKIFDLVPGVFWAVLVAGLGIMFGVQTIRYNSLSADYKAYRASIAVATLKAEQEARAKEREMQLQVERIAVNADQKQKQLAVRADAAAASLSGLRNFVYGLNARPAPADPRAAAYAREASVARELLGACSTEYRGLAEEADGLRIQVIGLQDYASIRK